MVKSELRVGNIVHATTAGRDGEVVEHVIKDGNDIDNAAWWFAIPLTEEWLKNLGGDYSEGKHWIGTSLAVELWTSDGEYLVYFTDKHSTPISLYRKIKYIHQLQNIYFSIAGEELCVK